MPQPHFSGSLTPAIDAVPGRGLIAGCAKSAVQHYIVKSAELVDNQKH